VEEGNMKILLINPVARAWAKPNCAPLGLGYIASVLRDADHEVEMWDLNALRNFKGPIPYHGEFDIIGLTGIITQYGEVKKIAQQCRDAYPKTKIVCGGSLATSVPDLLLRKTEVDSCIIGEGERVVFALLDDLAATEDIAACYYSDPVLIRDISTIPWPAYDLIPMQNYLENPIAADNLNKWKDGVPISKKRKSSNMIGSRGCVADCIFCYHCYMGQGWRVRSAADILGEMDLLKRRYGVQYVHFVDDAFACSKTKIMEFCKDKLISNAADIKWSCGGRANIVDEEMVSAMVESGCEGICYGLESGSQKMLDVMNKKITVEQYENAIALNKKFFKYQDYTFIVGTPGETDETIDESIQFCKRNEITPTAVFFMTPYPGTPLFENLLKSDPGFSQMVKDEDLFEQWLMTLSEQGEQIAWNCSGADDSKVYEWHIRFLEETKAWNNQKHS
jgi:radical SAM superfamily enzyme YgiQ (UPF0313 family)